MINVNFLTTKNGFLIGFDIFGHAEYADHGSDIICAAVSSAAFLTTNTISEIIKVPAEIRVSHLGTLYLKIKENDAALCYEILSGLKLHMLNLEEQYPENITVNYMEV